MSQGSPAVQDKCYLATTQEHDVEGKVRLRDTDIWGIESQDWVCRDT